MPRETLLPPIRENVAERSGENRCTPRPSKFSDTYTQASTVETKKPPVESPTDGPETKQGI